MPTPTKNSRKKSANITLLILSIAKTKLPLNAPQLCGWLRAESLTGSLSLVTSPPTRKVAKHHLLWYPATMQWSTLHRFDVDEYYRMADIGVLRWGGHDELLNGVVIDPFRITPLHASITHQITEPFLNLPKECCIVSIRNPVRLDEYNELQPDVMLLKRIPDYYRRHHPGPEDVLVLVEVADASLEYDRVEKLPVYARVGIAEVWLVNLNEMEMEIYREPNFTGYGSKTTLRAGDHAKPLAFPNVTLDVGELLKR
jgi:Uma2 family endonuclease